MLFWGDVVVVEFGGVDEVGVVFDWWFVEM